MKQLRKSMFSPTWIASVPLVLRNDTTWKNSSDAVKFDALTQRMRIGISHSNWINLLGI